MSTLRINKNTNFTVISNVHLQDKTLSWKAKGLLTYLLSLPNDWVIQLKHLEKQSTDGTDSTRTALNELIKAGYITKDYKRNEKGQIIGRDYIVYENPDRIGENPKKSNTKNPIKSGKHKKTTMENPTLENPTLDNPTLENPTLYITDRIPLPNTKITNELRNPPKPEPEQKSTQKTKSLVRSSVNNVESLKTTNSEQVEILCNLVPNHKRPENLQLLKDLISSKLNHPTAPASFESIELNIKYSVKHSTGNPSQFLSFMGQAIDEGWAENDLARKEEEEGSSKKQRQLEADRLHRERLEFEKKNQEQLKIIAKDEARTQFLESLKSLNPEKYKDTENKAVELRKQKYPNLIVVRDGHSIKQLMCEILGFVVDAHS